MNIGRYFTDDRSPENPVPNPLLRTVIDHYQHLFPVF
jgi:hypothetical protein